MVPSVAKQYVILQGCGSQCGEAVGHTAGGVAPVW